MGVTPASYADVFEGLARGDVRYVVVGSVGLVLRGHARAVADLDLVLDPAPGESRRALDALAAAGFVPSLPLPLSALNMLRLFDAGGREVDVFVRFPISFAELWAGAGRVPFGPVLVRVASLEHLLRLDRSPGGPHDPPRH